MSAFAIGTNYEYNLSDRFPVISGEYGGNAVTYDRVTGWVWHDAPGGERGSDSGAWAIRFVIIEGQAFWYVYRNGLHMATASTHGAGWQGAVDIAAAIQSILDYGAANADRAPRAIDDEDSSACGNYHNLDYTWPLIPGPGSANSTQHIYDRLTGWVWTCGGDYDWSSGAYAIQLVPGGWDLYYRGYLIGVKFGLWHDAADAALNWEQNIKERYGLA